ncbi:MAG TPA: gliding motility protein GldN, partial [Cyclobacteriaceae bacterium]|nr:gliding motility protein GldN [Cyclobacteriaceae bacterium]
MTAKRFLVGLALAMISGSAFAQQEEGQVNPNSLLNIPRYEQLYKVRVWRVIDLREKQNKGFFARGSEVTKLIINAVTSGELADIYVNDSITTRKSKEDFFKDMVSVPGATYETWTPTKDYYVDDPVTFEGKNYLATADNKGKNPKTSSNEWAETNQGKAQVYSPTEIYQCRLVEDVIFDKRRSRLYYDMLAMQFSAFDNNSGTFKPLGWFKYKDLEKLFRNHVKDAVWFNRYNTAENKNYADAFLLRLFHGTIEKVENPDDDTIYDTYNGRPRQEAVWATEWEEMKLME